MGFQQASTVIYEADGLAALFNPVHAALPLHAIVVHVRSAFEKALGVHRCGVVCLDAVTATELSWIAGLGTRRTECPIILVTPLTADSARMLAEYPAGTPHVVWLEEVPERLAVEVEAAVRHDPVMEILSALTASLPGPDLTGRALKRMSNANPPYGVVLDLAAALGVAPNTLRYHWTRSTGGNPTLKEFLEWVMLLRAAELLHLTPVTVAYRVGIHVRTLQRMSERRLGVTLTGIRRQGIDFVAGQFRERLGDLLA